MTYSDSCERRLTRFTLRCHALKSLNGHRSYDFQIFTVFNPRKLYGHFLRSNRKTKVIFALFGVSLPHSQSFSQKKFDFRPDTLARGYQVMPGVGKKVGKLRYLSEKIGQLRYNLYWENFRHLKSKKHRPLIFDFIK